MKSLHRLIRGGKPEKMKFASFGRERDLEMIDRYVHDPELRARYREQTEAAHNLNEGVGTVAEFIQATRDAVFPSSQRERDAPLLLLMRIAKYHPDCLTVWRELAESTKWGDRLSVAGRLYYDIPEPLSDQLFNDMRADRSARVRDLAIDRYKHRPDARGEIQFDICDPETFDDRVARGEVKL